jgi:hypothetical protein
VSHFYIWWCCFVLVLVLDRNATTFNRPGTKVHDVALSLETNFTQCVEQFRERRVRTAIKTSNRGGDLSDNMGRDIRATTRRFMLDSLKSSQGSLLVVPKTLLQHWQVRTFAFVTFL